MQLQTPDTFNNQYRVIETPKLYASRFRRRGQKVGESAEKIVAELKVLYDKAHGNRDRKTRDEDLVRRQLTTLSFMLLILFKRGI